LFGPGCHAPHGGRDGRREPRADVELFSLDPVDDQVRWQATERPRQFNRFDNGNMLEARAQRSGHGDTGAIIATPHRDT
jgi:hypothetical protein